MLSRTIHCSSFGGGELHLHISPMSFLLRSVLLVYSATAAVTQNPQTHSVVPTATALNGTYAGVHLQATTRISSSESYLLSHQLDLSASELRFL
jgi:hypothetical protein